MAKQASLTWQNVVFTWDSLTKTRILRCQTNLDFDVVLGAARHQKSMQKSIKGRPGAPQEAPGTHCDSFRGAIRSGTFFDRFSCSMRSVKKRENSTFEAGGACRPLASWGDGKRDNFFRCLRSCVCAVCLTSPLEAKKKTTNM